MAHRQRQAATGMGGISAKHPVTVVIKTLHLVACSIHIVSMSILLSIQGGAGAGGLTAEHSGDHGTAGFGGGGATAFPAQASGKDLKGEHLSDFDKVGHP